MPDSAPSSDDARVESILELWFERQLAGDEPDLGELCSDAPHLLPRIREMLERQDALIGPGRESPTRRPLPIDRLGDFELKSRIGSGGMGDVYLARETALDRTVALKVLRRELTDDPLRRLRFKREAQLTAALDHPNIVPIYGTGEDQGHVFLVMKHLPGTTLDHVPGSWEPRRIAGIGAQVARALHAAHEVGIVHRDIKPGNVQVDGDEAWVLDFGLARGRVDLTLTTEGQAPGTLAYMPPEQLLGDDNTIDPRGDIYSLGATLYQCVAGHPPFDEEAPEALIRRALIHDPEPLPLGIGDRDFGTIVMRALEKDRARRFPTALEFAEDLERFAAGEPIRSRPPSTLTRFVKLARRHRVKVAALAAAAFVALLLGPQLVRDAMERAADLDRQFAAVDARLADGLPAVALERLRELQPNAAAATDSRYADFDRLTQATLVRDALLDRIQLDSVYRQTLLDNEFVDAMGKHPSALHDDPLTLIALVFLARHHGETENARGLLHELGVTEACPRFVAAFRAVLDGRDPVPVLEPVRTGAMPAVDHVFTAVLLRVSDSPSREVDAEIAAALRVDPKDRRARMMIGIQHMIAGDAARAREVLTLLWDERRPSAELHCTIALLAIVEREYDRAAKHIEHADAALRATERPRNRWLELLRVSLATETGNLSEAENLIAVARAEFGDDEWFELNELNVQIQRGETEQIRAPLAKLAAEARVPWNRRRARILLLRLDVEAWAVQKTTAHADQLVQAAEQLATDAEAVNEAAIAATAWMARFDVAYALYSKMLEASQYERARHWEDVFWESLRRALAISDLHPGATFEAAMYMVNRIRDPAGSGENDLEIGDNTHPIRRRAVELTRRGYLGRQQVDDLVPLAVFGAFLSAAVGDLDDGSLCGSIAHGFLTAAEQAGQQVPAALEIMLDEARKKLGLDEWPAPPAK